MGKITLTGYVPESKAIEVYNKISKFTDYSKYIDIVKGITVEEISDNESISSWEVEFENGILCWKERDFFNDKELKIEFEKYEGDIEELKGFWSICQEKTGSVVTFEAEYSLGFSML